MSDLDALKRELEKFGEDNDAVVTDRPRRMLNITRDTGEFLSVLVRATEARRVLEIDTSNGYSTLWLAEAARAIGGRVVTVDASSFKAALAAANFERAGLSAFIDPVTAEVGAWLAKDPPREFDLIFLDSERPEYPALWPAIRRALRPGGLLVVDNATSHVDQMAPFVVLLQSDREFSCSLVPVGNGEFLAVRGPRTMV